MTEDELLEVATAIRNTASLIRRRTHYTHDTDLSPSEIASLARIERTGPVTVADLARREGITPQSMGSTVVGLEQRGLVVRSADPTDGRRALVTATEDGRRLLREARDATSARLAAALREHFGEREFETIRAAAPLIERLAHLI